MQKSTTENYRWLHVRLGEADLPVQTIRKHSIRLTTTPEMSNHRLNEMHKWQGVNFGERGEQKFNGSQSLRNILVQYKLESHFCFIPMGVLLQYVVPCGGCMWTNFQRYCPLPKMGEIHVGQSKDYESKRTPELSENMKKLALFWFQRRRTAHGHSPAGNLQSSFKPCATQ